MRLARALAVAVLAGLIVAASAWWPTIEWRPGFDRWLTFDWWPADEEPAWQGYVEAEFVDVGAEETARLVAVAVERGDRVGEGDALFRLDDADAVAAREEAAARFKAAEAELADLLTGHRPEEVAELEAQRDAAAATLEAARADYERQSRLAGREVVSRTAAEEALERYRVAEARVAEAEHRLNAARLPGRPDRIEAARMNAKAARAALARAEARLARLAAVAPLAARVEDVLFRAGEQVAVGRPVVRLLAPGNFKVRFFLPEPELGRLNIGDRVEVSCDGCSGPVPATVSFIAEETEFTPPVIYSLSARQKLVFMVEARPRQADWLKVGQPVDVRLGVIEAARR
ncbi:MAG TPA: HlyD family efflux transporter periplasmic adaptor subunit [Afifellaceae bacterium]|nr:HlyD family efflux transporter periplasmic adaptor subunit [Afifellaceae bacterium]